MKNLGKLGRDKITGFEGIIVSKLHHLFGCVQYALAPKVDKDGKRSDSEWFDTGRIEIIGIGIIPEDVKDENPGGEHCKLHP